MKTKRVNRYYCEFCKKSGCSKGHMATHEKHCTMNPDRECRMCKLWDPDDETLTDLMAVLPDASDWVLVEDSKPGTDDEYDAQSARDKAYREQSSEGMKKLRALTGCPICILAAIRQRGIARYCDFDFKQERDAVWSEQRDMEKENALTASTWL